MPKIRDTELASTKQLMGALVRRKPKPHEEMKVGKPKTKKAESQKPRGGRPQKIEPETP